jgi:hypothetical protein
MEKIVVNQYKRPRLNNPVLIGGLPGIGNVGKIAAEYLIDKMKMEKLADIFSQYFPPQVFIGEDGVVHLVRNSIYYKKIPKGKNDLLVLVGDFQGSTQEGQYELSYNILEFAQKLNVSALYTLGGRDPSCPVGGKTVIRRQRVRVAFGSFLTTLLVSPFSAGFQTSRSSARGTAIERVVRPSSHGSTAARSSAGTRSLAHGAPVAWTRST